jgi:hypothetical protein
MSAMVLATLDYNTALMRVLLAEFKQKIASFNSADVRQMGTSLTRAYGRGV